MPIEDGDYFIRVISFGVPVPACIRLNSDGTYSLYLNADYDWEHWIDGWEHEIWHILHDDMYGERTIDSIEPNL